MRTQTDLPDEFDEFTDLLKKSVNRPRADQAELERMWDIWLDLSEAIEPRICQPTLEITRDMRVDHWLNDTVWWDSFYTGPIVVDQVVQFPDESFARALVINTSSGSSPVRWRRLDDVIGDVGVTYHYDPDHRAEHSRQRVLDGDAWWAPIIRQALIDASLGHDHEQRMHYYIERAKCLDDTAVSWSNKKIRRKFRDAAFEARRTAREIYHDQQGEE